MHPTSSPPTDKPAALLVTPDSVPTELRQLSRWLGWRYEQREKGWTKVPIDAKTGGAGSATDPGTWATFDAALAAVERHELSGIGIVLGDGLVGVDLDKCRDKATGTIEDWASDIVEMLGSYAEVSVSETGVHVLAHGSLPPGRRRKGKVEMYSEARYFCVSGARLPWSPESPQERTAELATVHARWVADEEPKCDSVSHLPTNGTGATGMPDDDVLSIARHAKNGPKFSRLWGGELDGYTSQSEADSALCCLLGFYTGGDAAQVERLFSQSGLGRREKWTTEAGYRQRTIHNAIAALDGKFYSPRPKTNAGGNDAEPHWVEGPSGVRFAVHAVHKTSTRTTLTGVALIGDEKLSLNVSSAPTALDRVARDLAAMAGCDRLEMKRALAKLTAAACDQAKAAAPKATSREPIDVLMDAASKLQLKFVDNRERVWSEPLGRLLYQRQLVERLISPTVVQELAAFPEYADQPQRTIIAAAKSLASLAWGALVERLPEEAEAADLGPESRAASEARRELLRVLHEPRGWTNEGVEFDGGKAGTAKGTSLASLAICGDYTVSWKKVLPPFALWARVDKEGQIRLALRFELLQQTKCLIPGVHDSASFGRVLERYGILEKADSEADRVGRNRDRVRQISADMVAELSAVYFSGDAEG